MAQLTVKLSVRERATLHQRHGSFKGRAQNAERNRTRILLSGTKKLSVLHGHSMKFRGVSLSLHCGFLFLETVSKEFVPSWGFTHKVQSNFSPIQEADCATFSAVSDTRCSTYLIFTAFLTAECSTVELPGNGTTRLFSFYYKKQNPS